jgi:DNA (cytosine-5)-methyltransferase 1
MNVLDLFSGIGGFSLGLERAGMRTVAFCERDEYCRAVLAKHWPGVPCYDDVRTLTGERLSADGISPNLICGGFPCQDISSSGKGAGLGGERSGLWVDFARLIGEIRPRYAIVENVAALSFRGLLRVLGDLTSIGYDAEWHCIPASAIGAPHQRDRLWIIAYAHGSELRAPWPREAEGGATNMLEHGSVCNSWVASWGEVVADVDSAVYGISGVVDRLRPFGNAVVPQIPEIIGRAIMRAESEVGTSHE